MKIIVCIGSSCHLKGSRQVVERLQELIALRALAGNVELSGAFCMGNCTHGVSVRIDDRLFSVQPETVNAFFENEVIPRLDAQGKREE